MRGVDTEIDGDCRYALVAPSQSVRLRLNLLPHLLKVRVLLPFLVKKLRPLRLGVVELQDQRTSGHDA